MGDALNDLEMVGLAGLGVAVANAAAAKVTTARSWQGVGELLDFLLGRSTV